MENFQLIECAIFRCGYCNFQKKVVRVIGESPKTEEMKCCGDPMEFIGIVFETDESI